MSPARDTLFCIWGVWGIFLGTVCRERRCIRLLLGQILDLLEMHNMKMFGVLTELAEPLA
jgi:hypothetical protein